MGNTVSKTAAVIPSLIRVEFQLSGFLALQRSIEFEEKHEFVNHLMLEWSTTLFVEQVGIMMAKCITITWKNQSSNKWHCRFLLYLLNCFMKVLCFLSAKSLYSIINKSSWSAVCRCYLHSIVWSLKKEPFQHIFM